MWIGLFGVTGPPDNLHLQGCPGAYVTVVARAQNESDFYVRVLGQTNAIGLTVDEVLWHQPLSERLEQYELEDYLHDLAREAEKTGDVKFGIFHTWEDER